MRSRLMANCCSREPFSACRVATASVWLSREACSSVLGLGLGWEERERARGVDRESTDGKWAGPARGVRTLNDRHARWALGDMKWREGVRANEDPEPRWAQQHHNELLHMHNAKCTMHKCKVHSNLHMHIQAAQAQAL